MQGSIIRTAALLSALAFATTVAAAADNQPAAKAPAAKAQPEKKAGQAKAAKPAPRKLVDLNRASKAQFMKLPGVDEALAAKIVAGRPYRSKADLVTRDILPRGVYEGLKRDVVAKP